jgi:hypothetical protein
MITYYARDSKSFTLNNNENYLGNLHEIFDIN